VALVPDGAGRPVNAGHEVVVERGAGVAVGFTDDACAASGAAIAAGGSLYFSANTNATIWRVVRRAACPAPGS
jgi:alanine dehydrogenase